MNNISKKIDALYNKSSYSDKYGGSVLMTLLILFIFFIALSYLWVISHSQPIKDDWVNQRCSPSVIPFAGYIMASSNESVFDYTSSNFTNCIQTIGTDVVAIALTPITAFLDVIMAVWDAAIEAIDAIRSIISSIRTAMSDIIQNIYGIILGFLIPLQKMIISSNDVFSKIQGVMTASLFTGIGVYDTMLTGISAAWELIIIIFIAVTVAIIILIASFFAMPAGLIALAIYIPFAIIMVEFLVLMSDVMNMTGMSSMPSTPSCFASGTIIKTKLGPVNIEDLSVGTVLDDKSVVTSVMKLSSHNQIMYNLNGIIVSNTHKVIYNGLFIDVPNHPKAIKLDTFIDRYLYCFNTSNKIITINNTIFSDWDDLDDMDICEIKIKSRKYLNKNSFKTSDIHNYLESGFKPDTIIQSYNGNFVKIQDIKINDILKYGERVIGTVCIDASDITTYKHIINNTVINGGPNLQIYNPDLGIFNNILDKDVISVETDKNIRYDKMYHLLTDKNSFTINEISFYDYNGAIDVFLDQSDFNLAY